jgi:hypothetical protein
MPLGGLLLRVFWMILGPGGLLLTAITIAQSRTPQPGVKDLVFGLLLLGMLAARVLNHAWIGGWDSDGRPETRAAILRWVPLAAVVGLALWGLAHGVAWMTSPH